MVPEPPSTASVIWTIGHSTRPYQDFLSLLAEHRIEAVADVRRYPGSRRWPHFSREQLASALEREGIVYQWFPELGGRRKPAADSPNTAWRNAAFRGYADYLHTDAFADGIERLTNLGSGFRTVIMCAEAVWWRCHRALIADVLRSVGWTVIHIMGPSQSVSHPYTTAARLVAGRLSYAKAKPV